jgi:hypothetical protein
VGVHALPGRITASVGNADVFPVPHPIRVAALALAALAMVTFACVRITRAATRNNESQAEPVFVGTPAVLRDLRAPAGFHVARCRYLGLGVPESVCFVSQSQKRDETHALAWVREFGAKLPSGSSPERSLACGGDLCEGEMRVGSEHLLLLANASFAALAELARLEKTDRPRERRIGRSIEATHTEIRVSLIGHCVESCSRVPTA